MTNPGAEVTISVLCYFPFGLVSSNKATFKTVASLASKCTPSLMSTSLTNADEAEFKISCDFKDFNAHSEDIFKLNINLENY